MKFIVTTDEHVTGTYEVEAESEEAAKSMFDKPPWDWENVEQLDYMAYLCEVNKVVPFDRCTECDGRGFYKPWPHTTCPTCKGAGEVPMQEA